MYRAYHFTNSNLEANLAAALKDWTIVRQQRQPARIGVNPIHVTKAQTLTKIQVIPIGGCLSNEIWIEPAL